MFVSNQVSSCDDTFFRIGTLCGMALYNGCLAPFPFPLALYKKLLGLAPTLEDFKELLPDVGRYEPGRAGKLQPRRVSSLDDVHRDPRGHIWGTHGSYICRCGAAKSHRLPRWSLSGARMLLLNRGWHHQNIKLSPVA